MYDKFGVNRFVGARLRRRKARKSTKENLGIDRRISGDDDASSKAMDRKRPFLARSIGAMAKTKKPAAGGGAAGFRKKPNDSWEEECCHSTDDPGRRMGRLYIKGMREEVHRFDRNNHTYFLLS
ncbi:hypothetical protein [Rhizobium leguminosarum]|uniref:hypothetical protein n=1 Tax=Rhizobium leguminosarum TaxID=384 RepID=UPI0013EF49CB|nr:hypothetical protein [Rhizobium leguminosarum]